MSNRERQISHPQSKAAITINVQNGNCAISEGIMSLCDKAESILDSETPSKRKKKNLLDTAKSLLQLQSSVA